MGNILVLALLAAGCEYGVYSFIHKLRYGGGCCGERDAAPQKVKVQDRNKAHYPHSAVVRVDGMTCAACARRVENALNSLPGVWAAVDLSAGKAAVRLKEPAQPEALRRAVREAGASLIALSIDT